MFKFTEKNEGRGLMCLERLGSMAVCPVLSEPEISIQGMFRFLKIHIEISSPPVSKTHDQKLLTRV